MAQDHLWDLKFFQITQNSNINKRIHNKGHKNDLNESDYDIKEFLESKYCTAIKYYVIKITKYKYFTCMKVLRCVSVCTHVYT